MSNLLFLLFCVGLVMAKDPCVLKNQWGGNACSLQGGLIVESNPAHVKVTKENCNKFLQKADFKNTPAIKYPDAKSGEMYTLVMVDPDTPNHPEGKYYMHWILDNIPGDDIKVGDLKRGRVISPYVGPTPPQGTGTHRYMFLLYLQEAAFTSAPGATPKRGQFDLGSWLTALPTKLCGPVSGVQFRTNFAGKE